jgi:hypothetical protein
MSESRKLEADPSLIYEFEDGTIIDTNLAAHRDEVSDSFLRRRPAGGYSEWGDFNVRVEELNTRSEKSG